MMRRSRAPRGETFQEWKAKKDMEARLSKLDAAQDEKDRVKRTEVGEKERIKKNDAVKCWLSTKQDSPKTALPLNNEPTKSFFPEEQRNKKAVKEIARDEDKQKEDDITEFYSKKRDSNLTFQQWLEKKEQYRLAKIRENESRKLEKEAEEREKQEQSRRAVQEWLVKTKYRTLTRHYPKLNEQEINNRIWQDLKT